MKSTDRILTHSIKSYMTVSILGLFVGIVTRLTDIFPNDDIWGFSSITTLFGFWIITTTFIIYKSSSNINSAINTFLYLFFMSVSFYLAQPILGNYLSVFDNDFQTHAFVIYSIGSLMAGIAGFFLYYWNKDKWFSNILYALPVGVLFAEFVGLVLWFSENSTWLFQLTMDLLGFIILGTFFYRKANNKKIYLISLIGTLIIAYFGYYRLMI